MVKRFEARKEEFNPEDFPTTDMIEPVQAA